MPVNYHFDPGAISVCSPTGNVDSQSFQLVLTLAFCLVPPSFFLSLLAVTNNQEILSVSQTSNPSQSTFALTWRIICLLIRLLMNHFDDQSDKCTRTFRYKLLI